MRYLLTLMIIICAALGCTVTNQTPSAIGLTTVPGYIINPSFILSDSINYMVFTNKESFNSTFSRTKSSPGNAVVPDFNSQTVVAVALKPTTDIVEVEFIKGELAGKNLNIYYRTIKQTGSTFSHTATVVATVPRATDVQWVHFYDSTGKQKTLPVSF